MDAIVEGAVLLAGDRLRVTIRLIKAATDEPFWSESYERGQRDSRLFFLKSDGAWQKVSHDPRYIEMIERPGLAP